MPVIYSNNASTTLSSGINNSTTTVPIASASGFPSIGSGEYYFATIANTNNTKIEVVKVTAGTTSLTVVRGQDGTTAQAFDSGDNFQLRVTAATLEAATKTDVNITAGAISGSAISNDAIDSQHYADGSIDTAHIADDAVTAAKLANSINTDIATGVTANTTANAALPKAGGTMSGDLVMDGNEIHLADNGEIRLGSAADLKIYHDGSNSYIKDVGTGSLIAATSAFKAINAAENESMIVATQDGSVDLYHNGSKKFETTAAGATVTGVLTATLQNDAIDSQHYVDGSIDTAHIADDAITEAKLGASAVVTAAINDLAVTTAKINADAVTGAKIADDSIDSEHYANQSIDEAHIANNAVTAAKIADNCITATQIAASAVATSELADDAVTNAKIGADAVTGAEIANDAINSEHYVADSIDNEHLSETLGDLRKGVTDIGRDTNDYISIGTTAINFYLDGANDMRLENDGDLHVDGDVIAYSTTISDEALKYDINPVEFALDKINQLKGVSYKYKHNDRESAGLLAQDVEKVMPSAVKSKKVPLVTGDDKEYKTLHYDSMTAILVEAIKELTAKVKKLENK